MERDPPSRSAQLRAGFREALRAPVTSRTRKAAHAAGFVAGASAMLALILLHRT
ncbi:hypothetical protein [Sphingosinithalassobacter sp. LHW66-3]|uniref:hypothetical protein n=1 Tax=Sphingosinithalassobacter sp. LHW66-3 TaxID=3424718 RepID=UPI003D69FE40